MRKTLQLAANEFEVEPSADAVVVDGTEIPVSAKQVRAGEWSVVAGGNQILVRLHQGSRGLVATVPSGTYTAELVDPRRYRPAGAGGVAGGANEICAPMPGKIVDLLVAEGDAVESGQAVAVVEAMKMQNDVRARQAGTVAQVRVSEGDSVTAHQVLVVLS